MENNPYAAPRSEVKDVTPERHGRPVLVWIITILMAFGVVSGTISSVATLSGSPIGGQAVADYLKAAGLGPFDHAWSLALLLVSAVGYVDLFRLKRRALPILAGVLAAGFLYSAVKAGISPAYRAMFVPPGLWSILIGWAINLAIVGYVWRLRTKGVLQ